MKSHVLVFFSRPYFGLYCYNIINTTVLSYANLNVKKNLSWKCTQNLSVIIYF